MPVKKKVDKKKKLKQKQKQKQIVKQNVKVTVQSSGGSGGGGSSVPSRFTDTSGENVRLQGLIEQLTRRIPAPVSVPYTVPVSVQTDIPIEKPPIFTAPRFIQERREQAKVEKGIFYNPSDDDETVNKVFNAPNNNNNSISERIIADKLERIDPTGYETNLNDIQEVFNDSLNTPILEEDDEEFIIYKKLEKVKGFKKDVVELEALAGMLQRRGKEVLSESGIDAPYGLTPSGRIRKKPIRGQKATYSGSEGEM